MIDASRIATAGMAAASARLNDAAARVASPGPVATVAGLPDAAAFSLSDAALDVIESRASFAANAAVLRGADTMAKRLLDARI